MLTYGFFDSKNKDRTYNAEQMSSLFAGIITDGIFANYPAEGQQMVIQGSSNTSDLGKVFVGPGRGWFNNVWIDNDSLFEIQLDGPDASNPRRDAIVIEIHKHAEGDYCRSARIVFKKGTPAASPSTPSVSHDAANGIYRYRIGWVQVPAGDTAVHYTVSDSRIHNTVGVSGGVPFIIGAVNSVTAQNVLDGWHDAVNQQVAAQMSAYLDNQSSYLYTFLANRFDSIDAFLDNPSDHFRKIFYYHESPTTIGTPPYHGELNRVIGRTSNIVSDTANGGIGGLYPRNSTVKQGDILIGRSGTVAQIFSITRNEDTGYILSITVSTIGNVQGDLQTAFDTYQTENALAHQAFSRRLDSAESSITMLNGGVTMLNSRVNDVVTTTSRLAQAGNVYYYSRDFSDVIPGTETIDSSYLFAIYPYLPLEGEVRTQNIPLPKQQDLFISKNGVVGTVVSSEYYWSGTSGHYSLEGGEIRVNKLSKLTSTDQGSSQVMPPLKIQFTYSYDSDSNQDRGFCDTSFSDIKTAYENGREIIPYYVEWYRLTSPATYSFIPGETILVFDTVTQTNLLAVKFRVARIHPYRSANVGEWSWEIYEWTYTVDGVSVYIDEN